MTSADRPWPGASTSTTSWSAASASASGPQQRRVCVNPWTSTSGGPAPRRSACRNMRSILADVEDAERVWSDVGAMSTRADRPEDLQATFCATLVDEWARDGVEHAVVCPGSRSTPLALALAADDRIHVHVHHDERSGGFLALGLAAVCGEAVVVLTTSGTAAVELHPAVVEADLAGVPLLVCTANRPPELHDVGRAAGDRPEPPLRSLRSLVPRARGRRRLRGRSVALARGEGPRRGHRHPARARTPRPGVPRAVGRRGRRAAARSPHRRRMGVAALGRRAAGRDHRPGR